MKKLLYVLTLLCVAACGNNKDSPVTKAQQQLAQIGDFHVTSITYTASDSIKNEDFTSRGTVGDLEALKMMLTPQLVKSLAAHQTGRPVTMNITAKAIHYETNTALAVLAGDATWIITDVTLYDEVKQPLVTLPVWAHGTTDAGPIGTLYNAVQADDKQSEREKLVKLYHDALIARLYPPQVPAK